MSDVTVTLAQHHVHAIIDARVRLGLLQQLGVDFTLITDALDEIVQMCVENRGTHSVRADSDRRQLTPDDLRLRGISVGHGEEL